MKTVKMTLIIIFVFILCWSPYIVFDLLQVKRKFANAKMGLVIDSNLV